MMPSPSIRSWFEHPIQWIKTIFSLQSSLIFLLVVLFSAFTAVMFCESVEAWVGQLLGLTKKNETLTFLGIGMGGILLALQAVIANRRAQAMANAAKEQAKANENTERGQRQERLKNAIEHLGHDSDSVRLGGAYELFHLAQDTEDLRQTVMDILCAHIRRTTGESEYREKHKSTPSEEVQSLLTLLFVQEHEVFKGCHINLQGSWLKGANLTRVHLEGANLVEAHLQGTELRESCLHGAQLRKARLQGAFLERARLHGADLREAEMQVACLHGAQLQGACLFDARLQGATLTSACLQGIHYDDNGMPFAKHIRYWAHKESMLHAAIFEGGLSQKNVDFLVEGLPNENAKDKLREKLKPHIDKQETRQLPKDSHAYTGAYTEKEAERWIAEYDEAMAEVSKADNEQ